MKTRTILLLLTLWVGPLLYSQVPDAFKYQAVVRDSTGQILDKQEISVLVSIYRADEYNTVVYSETHSPTTNHQGLINLEIGRGTVVIGNFAAIDWGIDNFIYQDYFLQIEVDIDAGNNYQMMGATQILAVPYALYSRTADSLVFPFRQFYASSYVPAIDVRYYGDDCGAIEGSNSFYNTFGALANDFGGVYGSMNNNTGILGYETAGVIGNSQTGYAGSFSGKTYFEGNIGIYAPTPQDHLTIFRHYDDVNVGFYSDNNSTTNLKFSNELETVTWNITKRSMAENNKLQFRLSTAAKQEKILMTMSLEGKVGIGTTDPVTALHVMDQMNGQSNIKIQAPQIPPFEPGIIFATSIDMWRIYRNGSTNNLTFRNLKDFGSGIEDRLAINSHGNIGINTNYPQANLHINDLMMLEPRETSPTNPQEGLVYYDFTDHKLKVFDGTTWQNCY